MKFYQEESGRLSPLLIFICRGDNYTAITFIWLTYYMLFSHYDSVPAAQWQRQIKVQIAQVDYNTANIKYLLHADNRTGAERMYVYGVWQYLENLKFVKIY